MVPHSSMSLSHSSSETDDYWGQYEVDAEDYQPPAPLANLRRFLCTAKKARTTKEGEGDGKDGAATAEGNEDGEDDDMDDSEQLSKDDLGLLDGLDETGLASYLSHPVVSLDKLSQAQKLMKALHTITSTTADPYSDGYLELNQTAVADLVETLASALADTVPKPVRLVGQKKESEEAKRKEENRRRARLGLPPREAKEKEEDKPEEQKGGEKDGAGAAPSAGAETPVASTSGALLSPAAAADERVRPAHEDLAAVYYENTRLLLASLRPKFLFDPAPIVNAMSSMKRKKGKGRATDAAADADKPPGQCHITKLPAELLLMVMTLARAGSESFVQPSSYKPPAYDFHRVVPPPLPVWGSKQAAVRFTLGLGRVCKAWTKLAREVAYRELELRKPNALQKLNALLDDEPTRDLAKYITSLNVSVAPTTPESQPGSARAAAAARRAHDPYYEDEYNEVVLPDEGTGVIMMGNTQGKRRVRHDGEDFAKLLGKTSQLTLLTLTILPPSGGYRSSASFGDYLEQPVFSALSSTPSLRELELRFTSDFEELSAFLANLPNLEVLRVDRLDNLSGTPPPLPSAPHAASKLRIVELGHASFNSPTSLSSEQLCYLLEPAVAAGSLRELYVHEHYPRNLGAFAVLGGGMPQQSAAFATAAFADLLVRCGSALEKLVLERMSSSGQLDPSLAAAPHNNSLDYALSHLTSLRSLDLSWALTGSSLLDSLGALSSLTTLTLSGTPSSHTPAPAFANALALPAADAPDEPRFSALKELDFPGAGGGGAAQVAAMNLAGFGGAGGAGGAVGWTGMGMRSVRQAAEVRGVKCSFSREGNGAWA
ncbi:hypothetical protein JCM10207_000248 [Rhodosporidiobolus poonsookiae]